MMRSNVSLTIIFMRKKDHNNLAQPVVVIIRLCFSGNEFSGEFFT